MFLVQVRSHPCFVVSGIVSQILRSPRAQCCFEHKFRDPGKRAEEEDLRIRRRDWLEGYLVRTTMAGLACEELMAGSGVSCAPDPSSGASLLELLVARSKRLHTPLLDHV